MAKPLKVPEQSVKVCTGDAELGGVLGFAGFTASPLNCRAHGLRSARTRSGLPLARTRSARFPVRATAPNQCRNGRGRSGWTLRRAADQPRLLQPRPWALQACKSSNSLRVALHHDRLWWLREMVRRGIRLKQFRHLQRGWGCGHLGLCIVQPTAAPSNS